MKRFRDIIQDIKAPSTSDLWINNGELKYYTSNGWKAITGNGSSDVYVLPGNLQITTGWSTTDVESIVGNWDEFTKAVSDGKIIACSLQDEETIIKSIALAAEVQDGAFIVNFSIGSSFYIYIIDQSSIILNIDDTFLFYSSVTDSLNSTSSKKPLSANQGRILNDRVTELESKSNVAVLTPTGTKLMELVSSSPNVTQEQLAEAGFTPEICRRLNAGEVIYMSGECAGFGNDALYPIQGIAPNSSPGLVPSRLCYCHYSSYNADGTANEGCFTTIKKQSSGQYLVDYIEV
jgi:hypothetical protein|nr:MAG TPA: hypothetical protein [Crassvirales sp.]